MEYRVVPAEGRQVTEDLLRRFLRTAALLQPGVRYLINNGDGSDTVSARMELPDDPTSKRIINLASIDGFQLVPVPEDPKNK